MSAPPRIAGRREASVLAPLHGSNAAEEEVAAPPPHDVVPRAHERIELRRLEAPLAVDMRLVDVNARLVDRLAHRETVADDVGDDLEDGAPQADRARAPDDQSREPAT